MKKPQLYWAQTDPHLPPRCLYWEYLICWRPGLQLDVLAQDEGTEVSSFFGLWLLWTLCGG